MRISATISFPIGLVLIVCGCGKPAEKTPVDRPPAAAVEEPAPVEPADPDSAPPDSNVDAARPGDTPIAEDRPEVPSQPMADQPAAEQPTAEESDKSSSRKVVDAVQRALMRAVTGGSEQKDPPRTDAPGFKP